jgi:hypothetical protein
MLVTLTTLSELVHTGVLTSASSWAATLTSLRETVNSVIFAISGVVSGIVSKSYLRGVVTENEVVVGFTDGAIVISGQHERCPVLLSNIIPLQNIKLIGMRQPKNEIDVVLS